MALGDGESYGVTGLRLIRERFLERQGALAEFSSHSRTQHPSLIAEHQAIQVLASAIFAIADLPGAKGWLFLIRTLAEVATVNVMACTFELWGFGGRGQVPLVPGNGVPGVGGRAIALCAGRSFGPAEAAAADATGKEGWQRREVCGSRSCDDDSRMPPCYLQVRRTGKATAPQACTSTLALSPGRE